MIMLSFNSKMGGFKSSLPVKKAIIEYPSQSLLLRPKQKLKTFLWLLHQISAAA